MDCSRGEVKKKLVDNIYFAKFNCHYPNVHSFFSKDKYRKEHRKYVLNNL